ncbi:MAG: TetR family transcriptional regulator [Solirubrobacteraceae bacterium]
MSRWEPNAQGRLAQAAMELYRERGFEQTTVAEIAARAGLTERTFFRHFADKREVLFAGSDEFEKLFVDAVAGAPDAAGALDAVAAGLDTVGRLLQERRPFARQRQGVIAANADLQERERHKLASMAAGAADALRRRGVAEPAASLASEAGIAVFRIAFEHWLEGPDDQDLPAVIHALLDELKTVTGARPVVASA